MAFDRGESVAPKVGQTTLTTLACSIIDAPQTLLSGLRRVTVANGVLVNVTIAHTLGACIRLCIQVVTVIAQLAQIALRSLRTLQAHYFDRVHLKIEYLGTSTVVWTRTFFAHIRELVLSVVVVDHAVSVSVQATRLN